MGSYSLVPKWLCKSMYGNVMERDQVNYNCINITYSQTLTPCIMCTMSRLHVLLYIKVDMAKSTHTPNTKQTHIHMYTHMHRVDMSVTIQPSQTKLGFIIT